jgi:hypothetical protein
VVPFTHLWVDAALHGAQPVIYVIYGVRDSGEEECVEKVVDVAGEGGVSKPGGGDLGSGQLLRSVLSGPEDKRR